jgi:hypothetical protein
MGVSPTYRVDYTPGPGPMHSSMSYSEESMLICRTPDAKHTAPLLTTKAREAQASKHTKRASARKLMARKHTKRTSALVIGAQAHQAHKCTKRASALVYVYDEGMQARRTRLTDNRCAMFARWPVALAVVHAAVLGSHAVLASSRAARAASTDAISMHSSLARIQSRAENPVPLHA